MRLRPEFVAGRSCGGPEKAFRTDTGVPSYNFRDGQHLPLGQEVAAAWQEQGQHCPSGQHRPAEVPEPMARLRTSQHAGRTPPDPLPRVWLDATGVQEPRGRQQS